MARQRCSSDGPLLNLFDQCQEVCLYGWYLVWRITNLMLDRDRQVEIVLFPTPPKDANGMDATARCADGTWSWAQTRADACTANGGIAYALSSYTS